MLIKIDGNAHARCDIKVLDTKAPLKHVKITTALDNGSIGYAFAGDLATGEREALNLTQPTTALITAGLKGLVIVDAPELIAQEYTKTDNALKNYYNPAGDVVRAYPLESVKRFALSFEGFDGLESTLTVGKYVDVTNGSYQLTASAVKSSASIGRIVRVDQEGIATYVDANGDFVGNTYKMYVIDVL